MSDRMKQAAEKVMAFLDGIDGKADGYTAIVELGLAEEQFCLVDELRKEYAGGQLPGDGEALWRRLESALRGYHALRREPSSLALDKLLDQEMHRFFDGVDAFRKWLIAEAGRYENLPTSVHPAITPDSIEDNILTVLKEAVAPMKGPEIARRAGHTKNSVRKPLSTLKKMGLVLHIREGYTLPPG